MQATNILNHTEAPVAPARFTPCADCQHPITTHGQTAGLCDECSPRVFTHLTKNGEYTICGKWICADLAKTTPVQTTYTPAVDCPGCRRAYNHPRWY